MKALQLDSSDKLSWMEAGSLPKTSAHEILIEVEASGVNRADLLQRAGKYPPPEGVSKIIGLEVSGLVKEVGTKVSRWRVGERVCALLSGGGYASYALAHEDNVMPIPKNFSVKEAAALPEAYLTAHLNLFIEGQLKRGERVLIHGAGSGVGLSAVQLAANAGCEVFATAGTDEKLAVAKKVGASTGINYKQQNFSEIIKGDLDLILDINGAEYFERNLSLLRSKGRLVIIALMGGVSSNINLRELLSKRLTVKGSTLRFRSVQDKAEIIKSFKDNFWQLLEEGKIRPVIDSTFPITEVEAAHKRMSENKNIGKIVLTIP